MKIQFYNQVTLPGILTKTVIQLRRQ